jgi:hypothetical protein
MTAHLLTSTVWRDITRAAKEHPNDCKAAVAYFGAGANKLLPLKAGSILIVDMSTGAVGSGQTSPEDILALIKAGVEVHSVRNLHAKVFAFPRRVFVGSANVSHSSADGLIEAVLTSDERSVISAVQTFVDSLKGERVSPERAKALLKIYKKPRFGRTKDRAPVPRHSPLWLVPLVIKEWKEQDYQEADRARPEARRRMRSTRIFTLDEFSWSGAPFTGKAQAGDLVLQITKENDRKVVTRPGTITYIRQYQLRGRHRAIVFVEIPRGSRRLSLKRALHVLGPAASELRKLRRSPRVVKNLAKAHAILNCLG